MEEGMQPAPWGELPWREVMQTPDEVAAMLRLKSLGWGIKRIARELGCSHMTVRRYVSAGGWVPYRGVGRPRTLAGLEDWIAERFRRHGGNADVVRQELAVEKGVTLSLRTIERCFLPQVGNGYANSYYADIVGVDAFKSGKAKDISGIQKKLEAAATASYKKGK